VKRLFSMLFVLLFMLSLSENCYANLEEPEKYQTGEYTYTLDADGNASIVCWEGSSQTLIVPDNLDGRPVTSIGDFAFFSCRTVKWRKKGVGFYRQGVL